MATEIRPRLFVGDIADASRWEGLAITVLEDRPDLPPTVVHVPIYDPETGRARFDQMEEVVALISKAMRSGDQRILVSCGHGVERSPLAVVWYLYRSEGVAPSAGYDLVRQLRPEVQPRLEWLHGSGFPVWW
jgi:protein-tyrosine phosphatase